jgi:putative chitinase
MKMLSVGEIARATGATYTNAQLYTDVLNDAMARYHISTPERQAAFLANVAIESAHLTKVVEDLYYRNAERLADIFPSKFKSAKDAEPYVRNPEGIAQKVYGGFQGRGLIQITGKANYEKAGQALGQDFVAHPTLLARPQWAARSAAWYWAEHGCNELADKSDLDGITKAVNGKAMMHAEERAQLAQQNIAWMAADDTAVA